MDLFDMVRAAPPPPTVRKDSADDDAKEKRTTPSSSPLPVSPVFNLEDSDSDLIQLSPEREVASTPRPASPIHIEDDENTKADDIELIEDTKSQEPVRTSPKKTDGDAKIVVDDDDDDDCIMKDVEEDDEDQLLMQPPKTKAEQKMFMDVKSASKEQQTTNSADIRRCMVRIKRLKQSEIERYTTGKGLKCKRPRKRRQSSSDSSAQEDLPLAVKKLKSSNKKVHVKVPFLQNGSKKRSSLNISRAQTPPPTLKKSPKRIKPFSASKTLVKQYGTRFFNCYVKLKRLTDTDISTSKRTKRKSKSKLSVSFSEAVEILGSKPRKSSSISGTPKLLSKLCSSVPTRLQRVDATGNVLEDIELNPDSVFKSSTSSGSHKKRGRQASCNGGKRTSSKLKRPAVHVPVTDLASLRINDSHDEAEEEARNDPNEEYIDQTLFPIIVPNDMPVFQTLDVRRSGTPTPQKRITVTTTVSDDEDVDEPESGSKPECKIKETAETPGSAKSEKNKQKKVAGAEDEQTEAKEQKPVQTELEQKLPAEDPEQNDSKENSPLPTALADDDILEIQASLEDVRELHTPPSRQITPLLTLPSSTKTNRNRRCESLESESSFKSAHEAEISGVAQASAPPPVADNTLKGSDQPDSGACSTPQPPYPLIIDMPNLDEDELGRLVDLDAA
ncbi:protein bir1 isoform X2 [Drosophila hydei]|uniref:Protein bir1 isoform X2 n=1 Tax=Drosophila hydei TaxID=7224 RepID=A0A6J1LJK7_DROHY|nr:protein bir1 isoform X2 [Drosophila hydei]